MSYPTCRPQSAIGWKWTTREQNERAIYESLMSRLSVYYNTQCLYMACGNSLQQHYYHFFYRPAKKSQERHGVVINHIMFHLIIIIMKLLLGYYRQVVTAVHLSLLSAALHSWQELSLLRGKENTHDRMVSQEGPVEYNQLDGRNLRSDVLLQYIDLPAALLAKVTWLAFLSQRNVPRKKTLPIAQLCHRTFSLL